VIFKSQCAKKFRLAETCRALHYSAASVLTTAIRVYNPVMLFTQYLHNFKTGSRMFVASIILGAHFTRSDAQATVSTCAPGCSSSQSLQDATEATSVTQTFSGMNFV
jgi:hypothetical protein